MKKPVPAHLGFTTQGGKTNEYTVQSGRCQEGSAVESSKVCFPGKASLRRCCSLWDQAMLRGRGRLFLA